jgi:hypothetical protein
MSSVRGTLQMRPHASLAENGSDRATPRTRRPHRTAIGRILLAPTCWCPHFFVAKHERADHPRFSAPTAKKILQSHASKSIAYPAR